jgi:hypothetical protein
LWRFERFVECIVNISHNIVMEIIVVETFCVAGSGSKLVSSRCAMLPCLVAWLNLESVWFSGSSACVGSCGLWLVASSSTTALRLWFGW